MDRILSGGLLWCSPSFPASLQVAVRHSWFLCVTTHNADFGKNAFFDFDFIHFPPRSKIQFRGLEHPGLHGRCESLKLILELWWATAVHFASWNMFFFLALDSKRIGKVQIEHITQVTAVQGSGYQSQLLSFVSFVESISFEGRLTLYQRVIDSVKLFTVCVWCFKQSPFIFLSYIVCISFFVSAFSNTLFCICIFQTQLAILTEIGMARRSMLSVPTCDVCVGISTNSYPLLLGVLHGTPWRV